MMRMKVYDSVERWKWIKSEGDIIDGDVFVIDWLNFDYEK